jgi:hypothetical protein
MTNPLRTAREFVADALRTADIGVPVYPHPVESPRLPCVQVGLGDPWLAVRLSGGRARVGVVARVTVPVASGSEPSVHVLEDLVWRVLQVLPPAETIAGPRVESVGGTEAYVVDIPTHATSSNEE